MTWPPTPAEVAAFGQITSVTAPLTDATNAAVAFVERVRADLATGQEETPFDAGDDVVAGTIMLAINDYERRGSNKGAGEVDLYDRDRIDELLSIGKYAPFGFGSYLCSDDEVPA
jgi:hypothetical protein